MSGQLRTLRNRIRSVENTKKITRAMEMVAAAKLRRFQDMMLKARPFTAGLETLIKRVSRGSLAQAHPFIQKREGNRSLLILMTSDTGLCGSYNQDLLQMAKRFMTAQTGKTSFVGVGKSGITAFRRAGYSFLETFMDIRASRVEEILSGLLKAVEKIYLSGEVDSVYVIYSHFKTVTSYLSITEKLLPFEPPAASGKDDQEIDYIFEPSPEIIFRRLIPLYFEAKMRTVFLEAIVSEQIARMTAMHQATKNAKEMIDSLVLLRNKARQAAITKEIIEIVSGSRAQKLK